MTALHRVFLRSPPGLCWKLLAGLLLAFAVGLPSPRLLAGDDGLEPEEADGDAPAIGLEEPSATKLADQLFKQIETDKPGDIWEAVNRLARLAREHGAAITERLEKGLEAADEQTRLACARALCQLTNTEQAAPVLCKLVRSAGTAELRRLAAAALGLTPSLCGDDPVVKTLEGALKSETDALARIAIARSLWVLGPQGAGRHALLGILAQAAERNIKDEAALVLAENGGLDVREVRTRVADLYNEPTPRGERARLCWRNWEEAGARARDTKVAQGENMIREVVRTIKAAYPDDSKTAAERLFEDAAKGMVGGLDPFSQYMDREDVKNTQEMLQQDYGGIGAYVGMRDNSFVIVSPIYGSPADRAGLRANDIIQEVDGVKTNDMVDKGGMNTVIARLKGKPGTPVRLKYFRRSFYKPIEVVITRESIKVESVLAALLPAGIGYIRLTRFGERSTAEMQAALDRLLKEQHAQAVILDLRNNPGGLLRTGVEIADKFLAGSKLIVYSEGNKEFAPRKDYLATGGPEDEAFPMVALVGAGSASASEIVAGALQDHKRATLVGEKTFGKGSVQQIMPLRSTGRETQLRLTIAKYYLPSGRCIHEKGVDVDIEVKPPDRPGWITEELEELRRAGVLEDHVRNSWPANKDLYTKLASGDDGKCENWPGFDALYKKTVAKPVGPALPRNEVRAELRAAVRRYLQDEQKHELVFDLEEDMVLQRGILEALAKLNVDPLTVADYKTLPEKFKKKDEPAQQGAMLQRDAQRQP